ncbi:Starch-binding associating with outer membrane [Filimonas lacunae]|uniref:Starch-binding associating with outer membrane n=1 Tax=Filimonas lacunae TaxID=477680 RepID=A0A173M935_9BACT|nr:RagB/SusD family nutrient uptake outer membrane protein [Filimonas lacunae]BAV04030.1 outer membrane protein, nutrient binding [Filimonas lacunae]SIT16284.1 Starch-binding associating with outer membrane [Filimonas lacunae]
MKKHLYIFLLGSLTLGACKKSFLDENPPSSYTPITVSDSLGLEASLAGLYNNFSTQLTYSNAQGYPSVWQVGTDVANATANQQGIEIPYYNYTLLTQTDGAASYLWGKEYTLINLANTIIASLTNPSLNMTDAGRKAMDGEAKFFRGLAYNTLATCYGGVPIITTPVTGPKTDFVRAPLADVDALVAADLNDAVTNLPDIESVKTNTKGKMYGRANKYMAMQLLAEAYLRMGKNDLAEQQAQAVINSGRFSLIKSRYGIKTSLPGDYYSDMFVYGNERRVQGNTEAIWVLEQENPATVVGGNTDNAQQRRVWGAAYHNISGLVITDSTGGRALARLRLSNWVLYGLYSDKDIRNSQYNIRRKYYYNDPANANYGKQVPYTGDDTLFKICPHTTKWYQFDPNDVFGYAMIKDFMMMRLGETYLLLAEAQLKQGKLQLAADNINELRKRAFGSLYPAQGQVNSTDMTLDFLLDERARELIGEENRRMTLMRTKTLVDRAIRLNSNDPVHPTVGLTKTNLLLPIPLSEIQLNKDAVLEQNEGYH